VQAANDFIAAAKQHDLLKGRIDKPYIYFDDATKEADCATYSQIDYVEAYAASIPWVIERAVQEMAHAVCGNFDVLVIAATGSQCRSITKTLRKKGFANIAYFERDRPEATLFDGLSLILEDKDSNLGWRIAAASLLPQDQFEAAIKQAGTQQPFKSVLAPELRKQVKSLASKLRHIRDDKAPHGELVDILQTLQIDPYSQARAALKDRLSTNKRGDAAIRRVSIRVTTVQSSKGLAADLVCICYLDDQYAIKNADKSIISDQDVCNFLVALTRARKKVVLVSSAKKDPTFLGWIKPARITRR
jgi:hypothetical protein